MGVVVLKKLLLLVVAVVIVEAAVLVVVEKSMILLVVISCPSSCSVRNKWTTVLPMNPPQLLLTSHAFNFSIFAVNTSGMKQVETACCILTSSRFGGRLPDSDPHQTFLVLFQGQAYHSFVARSHGFHSVFRRRLEQFRFYRCMHRFGTG